MQFGRLNALHSATIITLAVILDHFDTLRQAAPA
jgi:hypothetical protein